MESKLYHRKNTLPDSTTRQFLTLSYYILLHPSGILASWLSENYTPPHEAEALSSSDDHIVQSLPGFG